MAWLGLIHAILFLLADGGGQRLWRCLGGQGGGDSPPLQGHLRGFFAKIVRFCKIVPLNMSLPKGGRGVKMDWVNIEHLGNTKSCSQMW